MRVCWTEVNLGTDRSSSPGLSAMPARGATDANTDPNAADKRLVLRKSGARLQRLAVCRTWNRHYIHVSFGIFV